MALAISGAGGAWVAAALAAVAQFSVQSGSASPWEAPPEARALQNPVKGDGQTVERGRKLYTRLCVPCHGTTGAGDGPLASRAGYKPRNLTLARMNELSDGDLFWKISKGREPMPAFELQTSARERWDVVSYVRTLVRAVP